MNECERVFFVLCRIVLFRPSHVEIRVPFEGKQRETRLKSVLTARHPETHFLSHELTFTFFKGTITKAQLLCQDDAETSSSRSRLRQNPASASEYSNTSNKRSELTCSECPAVSDKDDRISHTRACLPRCEPAQHNNKQQ